jgi:RNA polymerase sigma-70 factor (ECF subfamily)
MTTTHTSLLFRLADREDSEAWGRFVRLYAPIILTWIKKLGIERQSAEDLAQEVIFVIVRKAEFIRQNRPDSFRAWLRTVTLNKCRDWFRQRKQTTHAVPIDEIDRALDDPNHLFSEREYQSMLAQTAMQLMKDSFSETTWQACYDQVVENRSAKEVARKLGISDNAAYLARGRVLSRLRVELDGLWSD